MADTTAQVVISDAYGVKKVEKAVEITLTAVAGSCVVTLDSAFSNTPAHAAGAAAQCSMCVIPQLGSSGTWDLVYAAGPPTTITVSVTGENAIFTGKTIRAILVAYDQP